MGEGMPLFRETSKLWWSEEHGRKEAAINAMEHSSGALFRSWTLKTESDFIPWLPLKWGENGYENESQKEARLEEV